MKHKITDASVKRLEALLLAEDDGMLNPIPTIRRWVISEELSGSFSANVGLLITHIMQSHPRLVFQIAYYLSHELGEAEQKLNTIKRGFEAISEI